MKKSSLLLCASVLVAGCAPQPWQPVVDHSPTVSQHQYHQDLQQCQQLARSGASAGHSAAGGAVAGALLGGALMAIVGDSGDAALAGAGVGALGGAVAGAGTATMESRQIVRNCMRDRGHRVLN